MIASTLNRQLRIMMLTDDVLVDRRILLEAESLIGHGHEVRLLASWRDDMPFFELMGNVLVQRVPDLQPCGVDLKRNSYAPSVAFRELRLVATEIGRQRRWASLLPPMLRVAEKLSPGLHRMSEAHRSLQPDLPELYGVEHAILEAVLVYAPDLMHVHDLPRLRTGVLAKRCLGVPLIYDSHELYPEIHTLTSEEKDMLTRREQKYITSCDAVITVNPYLAQEMSTRYGITRPSVVLNAASQPQRQPCDERLLHRHFHLGDDVKILLYQGWMSAWRGLQQLVTGMADVPSSVHLVLMGYGNVQDELEEIASAQGIQERIHFKDAVSQEVLLDWTASADAGIIPYQPVDLNNYFCSPNKLFEFIASGLPIIGNDLPFLRDVIEGEGFGIVSKFDEGPSYAAAINRMFFDSAGGGPRRFASALREKGCKFSWQEEEKKLFEVYDQVLRSPLWRAEHAVLE